MVEEKLFACLVEEFSSKLKRNLQERELDLIRWMVNEQIKKEAE